MVKKFNHYPLLLFLLFYLSGIVLAKNLCISISIWFVFSSIFLLLTLVSFRLKKYHFNIFFIAISVLLIGGLNYSIKHIYPSNHLSNLPEMNRAIKLEGKVDRVFYNNKDYKKLRLDDLKFFKDKKAVKGKLILYIQNSKHKYLYGDEIRFQSKIKRVKPPKNPELFDYQQYLQSKDVFATGWLKNDKKIYKRKSKGASPLRYANILKIEITEMIHRATNPEVASILVALLTGNRGEVSKETEKIFVNSGVIHVLAVSGLHVGYISLIFLLIFGFLRFPRKLKYLLTILGLWFYTAIVNFKPSVVRAVTMASCLLGGKILERNSNIYNIVAFAALLQTIIKPEQLFSIGFQLSFIAVFSIIYFNKRLIKMLPAKLKPENISNKYLRHFEQLFLVSLSAQLGIFPLIIFYFNKISLIALFLNMLAVPLVSLIGALGFAQVILGFIWSGFNIVYGELQNILIHFLRTVVKAATKLPWAHFEVPQISLLGIILLYLGLLMILNIDKRRVRAGALIFGISLANLWVWNSTLQRNHLEVLFFDLGKGESCLVQTTSGKNILIDCGEKGYYKNDARSVIAKYLNKRGVHKIDLLILSHPHNDHIGGAPYIIKKFNIQKIWSLGLNSKGSAVSQINHLSDSLNISIHHPISGEVNLFDKNLLIKVCHPFKRIRQTHFSCNNNSIVIKLSFGEMDLLFTGDIEQEAEQTLVRLGKILESEILKVPHHGSNSSSTSNFINNISPELAIITGGDTDELDSVNRVVNRYRNQEVKLINTNTRGAVKLNVYENEWEIIEWK